MKARRFYLSLFVFSGLIPVFHTIDPVTGAIAGAAGVAVASVSWKISSYFRESCDSGWIKFNEAGLQAALKNKLVGQHIASPIIFKAVAGFMNNPRPQKPLVLSLQGPSGTGKNFVAKMIANNTYTKGSKSQFFHVFTAQRDFPDKTKIEEYKSQLSQWIRGNVSRCARSMFVFDEVNHMHPGLIDSLESYLEFHSQLDGVSYRNAIFIFLSNTGAFTITEIAFNFWLSGRAREEIKLKDLEKAISQTAFNENSGLWHSSLIDSNLVNFFVPFLPMEHRQVLECVFVEMKTRGLSPSRAIAEELANDLVFVPDPERVFSSPGCKTIPARLDFYI